MMLNFASVDRRLVGSWCPSHIAGTHCYTHWRWEPKAELKSSTFSGIWRRRMILLLLLTLTGEVLLAIVWDSWSYYCLS